MAHKNELDTIACPTCGAPCIRRMTYENLPIYLERTRKRKPRNGLYVVTGPVRCRPALYMVDEGQTLWRRCRHKDVENT